jgi:hypothetical protein
MNEDGMETFHKIVESFVALDIIYFYFYFVILFSTVRHRHNS